MDVLFVINTVIL